MVNQEVLEEYSSSVRRLRKECIEAGMTEAEFKKLYFETLQSNDEPLNVHNLNNYNSTKKFVVLAFIILALSVVIINYKTLYSCISCNLQDYIYPMLRLLRKLSIPFISLFPSLSALYHETCLIQNPFFTVVDMDCWPCSNVNVIREIYEPKPVTEQQMPPFIYKTEQNVISIETLKKTYLNNKKLFERDAPNILSETKSSMHPNEMFHQYHTGEKHSYIWKFNYMNEAKVLRQIIPRPKIVPKFGQSTERFIIVDTSQKSLAIPDTECSFSFLLSLGGTRTIHLIPAEECRHQCKALKVELHETYLLWYNWWYWRPMIQPSNGNETFIAHVGSYC